MANLRDKDNLRTKDKRPVPKVKCPLFGGSTVYDCNSSINHTVTHPSCQSNILVNIILLLFLYSVHLSLTFIGGIYNTCSYLSFSLYMYMYNVMYVAGIVLLLQYLRSSPHKINFNFIISMTLYNS